MTVKLADLGRRPSATVSIGLSFCSIIDELTGVWVTRELNDRLAS